MNDIQERLDEIPRAILARNRSLNVSVWLAALVLVPLCIVSGDTILRFLAFLIPLGALGFTMFKPHDLRELREKPAMVAWQYFYGEWSANKVKTTHESRELGRKIWDVYKAEPTGRLFPLEQSARLFETYLRQQGRLQEVENRLFEIGKTRDELREKLDELEKLSGQSESGRQTFEQVDADYRALENAKNEILASCRRLELLVMGIENTAKNGALTPREKTPEELADADFLMPTDEAEIERQLTREIETYQKLERETQAHWG